MGEFRKLIIHVQRLKFFAQKEQVGSAQAAATNPGFSMEVLGKSRTPGYIGNYIYVKPGTRFQTSLGYQAKDQFNQLCTAANAAITTGLAVSGGITIYAQSLTAGPSTVLAATLTNQPDVPRNLTMVSSNASLGDGTFTSASAAIVAITGLNQFNDTITESVALNGTTAVVTFQAFASITSITYPGYLSGGDTVTIKVGAKIAFERPVQTAGDLIEIARKVSAATAYTTETLPATVDVGECWTPITSGVASGAAGAVISTTLTVTNTAFLGFGTPAFPTAPYLADILWGNSLETVTVLSKSTSGAVDTLTILRGLHGQTTARPTIPVGAIINWRSGQTFTPTLTANDRLKFTYRSGAE